MIVTLAATNIIPVLNAIINTPETSNAAINTLSNNMTIIITNIYSNYLSLFFNSNINNLTPVNNPSPTKLTNNTFTQYAFLTK